MNVRRINSLFAIAALVLITGCIVDERMFWSPDGRRAAVRLPEGLCLMDVHGKLSAPLISDVTFTAWLPDSRGLVVLRRLSATNWQEISRLVPREETAPLEALTLGLPGLMAGALDAAGGDASAVEEKFFKPLKLEVGPALVAGLICLRDTQPETFSKLLGRVKNTDQLQKDLAEAGKGIVHEISVLRLEGDKLAGEPLVLERTLAELGEPRPSPSAPVVAFLREDVLTVVPLNGSTNRVTVSDKIAGSYDWTPDGKALVFAVRLSEQWDRDTLNLVHIQRRVAVGPSGQPSEGDTLLLGTVAFAFAPRVRCLPDGRVLFASQPLQLPASANSTSEARFYVVDPARGTKALPVAIASEPGALPADLAAFAVSPDGRHIAIGESGSDAIAVLEIATGRLEIVSAKRGARNRTMPAWRGSDELYFAALPEAGARRPEWMCWRKGTTPEVFSAGWPDTAVQDLVEIPK
jgi:hypothetical protein